MKTELKVIQHVMTKSYYYEGMFLGDKLLGGWHENDGNWRGEYFDGMLRELGYQVKYEHDLKKKADIENYEKLQALLSEAMYEQTEEDGEEDGEE